jgi:hypothetical protein
MDGRQLREVTWKSCGHQGAAHRTSPSGAAAPSGQPGQPHRAGQSHPSGAAAPSGQPGQPHRAGQPRRAGSRGQPRPSGAAAPSGQPGPTAAERASLAERAAGASRARAEQPRAERQHRGRRTGLTASPSGSVHPTGPSACAPSCPLQPWIRPGGVAIPARRKRSTATATAIVRSSQRAIRLCASAGGSSRRNARPVWLRCVPRRIRGGRDNPCASQDIVDRCSVHRAILTAAEARAAPPWGRVEFGAGPVADVTNNP